MNIFDNHLSEIQNLVLKNKAIFELKNTDNLKSVNLEIPPDKFNFDLSCNIAMVLGKKNKINPTKLAFKLKDIFLKEINSFSEIDITILKVSISLLKH